jgi:hypothetical protein
MTAMINASAGVLLLAGSLLLGGCATLTITPPQQIKATTVKQPVNVGILVVGERLREALNDPQESAATATSGKLFNKVTLLPDDARTKTPAEIQTAFDADYILSSNLTDITVNGNLNPLWFASIPLLFFKPYAPIVTFEAIVSIEGTVREARTGNIVFQKEMTALVTDHFSPVEPQAKVRKLIGRGINNAFMSLLEEAQLKVGGKK